MCVKPSFPRFRVEGILAAPIMGIVMEGLLENEKQVSVFKAKVVFSAYYGLLLNGAFRSKEKLYTLKGMASNV